MGERVRDGERAGERDGESERESEIETDGKKNTCYDPTVSAAAAAAAHISRRGSRIRLLATYRIVPIPQTVRNTCE